MEGTGKLYDLITQEGGAFHHISHKWRPQDLLLDLQTKQSLADMERRLAEFESVKGELGTLPRAEMCLKMVRQLKLVVRRAKFVRRSNHLAFLEAVSEFYAATGELLKYLKTEEIKGHIQAPSQPK